MYEMVKDSTEYSGFSLKDAADKAHGFDGLFTEFWHTPSVPHLFVENAVQTCPTIIRIF